MTIYEASKQRLLYVLERYREIPNDAPERDFIDRLINKSGENTYNDPNEKKLHNLIILRYLTEKKLPKKPLCRTLHISRTGNYLDHITEKAVERLLALGLGLPDWSAQGTTELREATRYMCNRVYNTPDYNAVYLIVKNYIWLNKCYQSPLLNLSGFDFLSENNQICSGVYDAEAICTSIRKNYNDTAFVMERFNEMLSLYKTMCERSEREDDLRNYKILESLYLSDERIPPDEVEKRAHVCKGAMYSGVRKAISDLTVLIFGIGSIKDLKEVFTRKGE